MISANNERAYGVSAALDMWSGTVFISMTDRRTAVVPLAIFRPNPTVSPDFEHPGLDDWGQTIRFGEYEASIDFALSHKDTMVLDPAPEVGGVM